MNKKQRYDLLKDAVRRENDTNKSIYHFKDFTIVIRDDNDIKIEVFYKDCYLSEMIFFDGVDYNEMELIIFDRFIWGIYDTVRKLLDKQIF
jgi:hypothetical protein